MNKKIIYAGQLYEVISESENELTLRSIRDSSLIIQAKKNSHLIEEMQKRITEEPPKMKWE